MCSWQSSMCRHVRRPVAGMYLVQKMLAEWPVLRDARSLLCSTSQTAKTVSSDPLRSVSPAFIKLFHCLAGLSPFSALPEPNVTWIGV